MMDEKWTFADLMQRWYSNKRASEIAEIHPSTMVQMLKNPQWPSTAIHLKKVYDFTKRELEAGMATTNSPEHKRFLKELLSYMKTMEMI